MYPAVATFGFDIMFAPPAEWTHHAYRSFWQGRKVFLTGHTGFEGSLAVVGCMRSEPT
jgi:hypothetical protein